MTNPIFFNKNVFYKTGIFSLLALLIVSCSGKSESVVPRIVPVKVLPAAYSGLTTSQSYVGTAEGTNALSLSFSLNGTVEKVAVTAGQSVRKGQLLAALNSASMQNTHQFNLASYKQAQDAYNRMKDLHAKGSLPDIKFVEIETGLEKAKAALSLSSKNLADTRLYSPASGIVAECNIAEGENAMPGVAAFKLVSIGKMNIVTSIPESEIGGIHIGQSATVKVAALNNSEFLGKVEIKGIEANPVSHTYEIKIAVSNPGGKIMPGMVCKVFLQKGNKENIDQMVVPNKVVQVSADDRRYVWLVVGNKATRRFVTTGELTDYGVVVADGLQTGDQLIVEGASKVSEGMQVTIVK